MQISCWTLFKNLLNFGIFGEHMCAVLKQSLFRLSCISCISNHESVRLPQTKSQTLSISRLSYVTESRAVQKNVQLLHSSHSNGEQHFRTPCTPMHATQNAKFLLQVSKEPNGFNYHVLVIILCLNARGNQCIFR